MTRQDMRVRVAQLLNLKVGDQAYGDPMAMDNAINRVTDEFAGPGMDCYWTSETMDVVAEQAEYCVPTMYKLTGAYWLDAASDWRPLIPSTPQRLDQTCWAMWRNVSSQSNLIYILYEGDNRFVLYPKPNFSRTGGLKFEGYAQTNASGISTWAADTTACPLPTWCHEAIVYGTAVEIASTLMLGSDNPAEVAKAKNLLPFLVPRATKLRGQAESAAVTFWQSQVKTSLPMGWESFLYLR